MISLLRSYYHLWLAFLGNVLFWFPSRKIFVVGVTGTKGKSTVIELMNAVMEGAGKRTALISSVRRKVCDKSRPNLYGNTMPGRFVLQRFLREAVRAGCEYVFIEVTSEGVRQHRHRYIDWNAAVFVNLAPEHIESHGSFERYREAKVDFFRSLNFSSKPTKYFFINEEDPNHHYFEEAVKNIDRRKMIFFGRERFIKEDLGSHYDLSSSASRRVIGDWLLADFNLENAAAAVVFARSRDIGWETIKKAFDNFRGVPGRLEFVQKAPFAVVVDYAHTVESLKKVYETLEPASFNPRSGGEMICVLGAAGGGRDKWKRPVMGRIAAEFCHRVILTNEDPYNEDPREIIKHIENGFLETVNPRLKMQNYYRIVDRKGAIRKAIALAQKGDVVVITGKGSEPWLHIQKGQKIPWSDRKEAEEAIEATKRPNNK